MTDPAPRLTKIAQAGGRVVYRRRHAKGDGRRLFLYGYAPHAGDAYTDALEGAGPGAELRRHPLTGEWSIYAAHRQNRTFMPSRADDPLAPSNRDAVTEIEFDDFELAVFQNRFASLHPDAASDSIALDGVDRAPASGDCEVVVYTPAPEGSLATLGQDRRRLLLTAWIDRYQDHFNAGAAYVLPFENRGREVGVTLDHPHGQIYAFPFTPQVQKNAARAYRDGFDLTKHLSEWTPTHLVDEAGPLVAFVPPFARFPYEVWITSRKRAAGPWAYDAEAFDAYAHLLGEVTARYDALFQRPAATLMSLQAAPQDEDATFQFTTQFYSLLRAPDRVKHLASVEQATGVFTVDVMPEAAASALRSAL